MKKILLFIFILFSIHGIGQNLIASYPSSNANDEFGLKYNSNIALGEQFTPSFDCSLSMAKFYVKNTQGKVGTLTARIYGHTGTCGTDALGTGSPLAISNPINANTLNTSTYALQTFTFLGSNQIPLLSGTCYIVVIYLEDGDNDPYKSVNVSGHYPHGYASNNSGQGLLSGTWRADPSGDDIIFYVYGNGAFSANDISNLNDESYYSPQADEYGQTFYCPYNTTLGYSSFPLRTTGSPSGNIKSYIYDMTATYGNDGTPTGSPLAVSDTVNISTLTSSFNGSSLFTFTGSNQISLTAGHYYVITCKEESGGTFTNYDHIIVGDHYPNGTDAGNVCDYWAPSNGWEGYNFIDLIYSVYSTTYILPNTILLSSLVGTDNQTVIVGTTITNITYATTGATGASVTGLPTGVSGSWSSNVVTISGTPSVTGTFNYAVTLTGDSGTGTATGTITVNPATSIKAVNKVPQSSYNKINGVIKSSVKKINGITN